MASGLGCAAQRYASVLVWLPLLAVFPLLSLHGSAAQRAAQVILVAVMVVAAICAVSLERRTLARWALLVLFAAVAAGASQGDGWQTPWIWAAITAPVVLRGWWLAGAIGVATIGSALGSRLFATMGDAYWFSIGGVLLAGVATTSFLRLTETVEELRRTRLELARVAVEEERERFSRDLHDLLGHTLSVMVVKAQAVRRLADRDPAAAAAHAADIERVGREALVEVREAVDAMRSPSLAEAVAGAARALDAAGIRTVVAGLGDPVPSRVDETLAWVVREGATNVLRHSGAANCRIEMTNGAGELRLVMADDGVGGPAASSEARARQGGLDGLRSRVVAAGGRLEVEPTADGFRLTAQLPVGTR